MYKKKIPVTWRFAKTIISIQTFIVFVIGRIFPSKIKEEVIDRNRIENIIVLRLDGMGDVVLSSVFLRELRYLFPSAKIDLIVRKVVINLVEKCPYVDKVYSFNTSCPYFLRFFILPIRAFSLAYIIRKDCKYDLLINPRWDTDGFYGSYLAFFLRAKWRLAYSEKVNERKSFYNSGFDKLYTHLLEGDKKPLHEIERSIEIIRYLESNKEIINLNQEVWFDINDELFVKEVFEKHGIREKSGLVAIGVGAGHPKRIWPIENFTDVTRWLIDCYAFKVIIIGDSKDKVLGEKLIEKVNKFVFNICGQTTLRQTSALLKHCKLFIGNDSGLLHLSAATGIPVIGIYCHPLSGNPFNENSPIRFKPYTRKAKIVQPKTPAFPCIEYCRDKKAHCIKGVLIEDVKRAVKELIN